MRSLQWPCTCMNGNSYRKRATTTLFGSRRSERGCVRTETTTRTQTIRRYSIVLFLPSRPFFSNRPLLQIRSQQSSPVQSALWTFSLQRGLFAFRLLQHKLGSPADRAGSFISRPPIALWPNVTQRLCVIKKKKARACAWAGDGGIGPTDIGIATCFGPPRGPDTTSIARANARCGG